MPRMGDESLDDSENDVPSGGIGVKEEQADGRGEDEEQDEKIGAASAEQQQLNDDDAAANDMESNDVTFGDPDRTPGAGYHNIATLGEDINLLDYVREHNTTLTFPEKVRTFRSADATLLCDDCYIATLY